MTMLDFDRIAAAVPRQQPYPFAVIECAIPRDPARAIVADFPKIDRPGAVPLSEAEGGPAFDALLADLTGERFRAIIAEKFGLDLAGKSISANVRGMMRRSDGNIHTDTGAKLVTVLIYFNEHWPTREGSLRILNNRHDLDDYAAEVPPELGTMVLFQVTPDCWHGHTPVSGKRLSMQMNYLSGVERRGKHQWGFRALGKVRRLFYSPKAA